MRHRGFGKARKKSNMKNRNNPEIYSNGKKFKDILKKEDKHNRLHGKRKQAPVDIMLLLCYNTYVNLNKGDKTND